MKKLFKLEKMDYWAIVTAVVLSIFLHFVHIDLSNFINAAWTIVSSIVLVSFISAIIYCIADTKNKKETFMGKFMIMLAMNLIISLIFAIIGYIIYS